VIDEFQLSGIIHLAGLKYPEESLENPDLYMNVNYEATKNLIDLAIKYNVGKFVFSSSSSVYGEITSTEMSEEILAKPLSPYGQSKLLAENYLTSKIQKKEIKGISLRYFNVVGTASETLADNSRRNIFPLFHNAFRKKGLVNIYGSDYSTPDGTCIRDYIHVSDLASMHIEIMNKIPRFEDAILNLGRGSGLSVLEIYEAFVRHYGYRSPINWMPRRPGDPAKVVGDVTKLQKKYGMFHKYNLLDMLT
jgi:UDP-glucose 4-epimerase